MPGRTNAGRGHTLPEVLIASGLLLMVLGMVVVPFTMVQNAMQHGQGKIDTQQGLRVPLSRMVRETTGGYSLSITKPASPGTSNSLSMYDNAAKNGLLITYSVDAQGRLNRTALNAVTLAPQVGSPRIMARGLSLLSFQPQYEDPLNPGQFLAFQLPIPDNTTTNDLPPDTRNPPPQNTVVLVDVVAFDLVNDPNKITPINIATSFCLRN